ncbi:MAG: hypothetical protein R3A51_16225 [Nannocystaceae bacterium]|nr:hypothetical protein [Myxococcales bacterium]
MHARRLARTLLVAALTAACADAPVDSTGTSDGEAETGAVERDPMGFEVDPPGLWLAGDLHVHATGASNDTGGDSLPADIAARARAIGLAFVVLTDHSNSTGSDPTTTDEDPALFNRGPEFPLWDEAAALSVAGEFILVSGNELSPVAEGDLPQTPTGHIGCVPGDLDDFDVDSPFIDRPRGQVTGGDALAQARARGCFTIVNHPYAFATWINYDWTSREYDAMEVWNGSGDGLDDFDMQGHAAWRCDLLQGRAVTPIAASDNHRVHIEPPGEPLDPPLGWPVTEVFAERLEWPAIMAGLSAGRVALGEGDSRLYLDGYDGARLRHEGAETRVLRLRGRLDARATSAVLELRRATACDDPRPEPDRVTITDVALHEQTVAGGESFDVAVDIAGEPGVYTATLLTGAPQLFGGARYSALSRAIVLGV